MTPTPLENTLGYVFQDRALLRRALTHSSHAFENATLLDSNETLEFLGDAVLDLVVSSLLLSRFPQMREGEMTRLRAATVNETSLAVIASGIGLGEAILLGRGEEGSGGRNKPSILSGCLEALFGALFQEAGYQRTFELVQPLVEPLVAGNASSHGRADSKSRLQERLQEHFNEPPEYGVDREEGPDHDKRFTCSVHFRGLVLGTGCARNKKEAEQQAAAQALESLAARLDELNRR